MEIADYISIATAFLIVVIVASVIRSEILERRYHRHYKDSIRRTQMKDERLGAEN